ncbi:conserved hypothetical protein [uncultured delta proteobacterium]|uniref:Xylose isomerase-like TIM barrel domain-containing protein n=1 Tax=uncultured delta proteobacterium TaxID=34034 RepID=A0A212KCJ2_9DELT|nr:conserved hypothetical protein [uncultured delta proteobacterium]
MGISVLLTADTKKCFRIAAPSWIMPGTVQDNCAFLGGKVDEVGLLFLEAEASLAYGRQDLPPELAALGLSCHVHLPTDLPWNDGGGAAAAVCLALMEKVRFWGAERAVLHPPPSGPGGSPVCREALAAFARVWQNAGRSVSDVLLENTRENALWALGDVFHGNGFGICPDLGHILAYGQRELMDMLAGLPERERPRMLHCSAPGPGLPGKAPVSAHRPLDTLDAQGLAVGKALCDFLAPGGVIMVELFDWDHIARSLPVIAGWCAAESGG